MPVDSFFPPVGGGNLAKASPATSSTLLYPTPPLVFHKAPEGM